MKIMEKPTDEKDISLKISNSVTHCGKTACGNIYVTLAFKEDSENGKIDYVLIEGGGGECGKAWYSCVADMLTFSLRRLRTGYEGEVEQVIKNFSLHRCNKQFVGHSSCPHAIGQILKKVLVKE